MTRSTKTVFPQTYLARIFALSFISLTAAGCISYSSKDEHVSSSIPGMQYLQTIELGKTHSEWLIEQFGQPDAVRRPSDAIAIWQYENVANRSTRVRAFPLISVNLKDQQRTTYNFEVENNYIVRYWRDPEES